MPLYFAAVMITHHADELFSLEAEMSIHYSYLLRLPAKLSLRTVELLIHNAKRLFDELTYDSLSSLSSLSSLPSFDLPKWEEYGRLQYVRSHTESSVVDSDTKLNLRHRKTSAQQTNKASSHTVATNTHTVTTHTNVVLSSLTKSQTREIGMMFLYVVFVYYTIFG
jgi:hypothetical protein